MPAGTDSPAVSKISEAITRLMIAKPFSQPVFALYDRWVKFVEGTVYVALPDTALYPVLKAFAAAYVVIAKLEGVQPKDVDPSLIALAAADGARSLEAVSRGLDQTLEAAKHGSDEVVGILWKPTLLIVGVLLAIGYAQSGALTGALRARTAQKAA
jgi:hypothetical protein